MSEDTSFEEHTPRVRRLFLLVSTLFSGLYFPEWSVYRQKSDRCVYWLEDEERINDDQNRTEMSNCREDKTTRG